MALTGTFEELTSLFIFAGWIFYGLAVASPVSHAEDRAGFTAAVSMLGLSVGTGVVCRGSAGVDGEHLARTAGKIVDRLAADFGGTSLLQILEIPLTEPAIRRGAYICEYGAGVRMKLEILETISSKA